MNKKTFSVLLFFFLFIIGSIHFCYAQDTTVSKSDRSLAGQYKELIDKSNNYQEYKVIDQNRLAAFRKSYMDTLGSERRKLTDAATKIKEQSTLIAGLKKNIETKERNLAKSNAMIDEVQLLGIAISKNAYSIMMWGLVLGLGLALAFIIFQSTGYRKEARYRIKLFEELSSEFQAYKTRMTDKEKKLARELQTERNKLDEMAGRYR